MDDFWDYFYDGDDDIRYGPPPWASKGPFGHDVRVALSLAYRRLLDGYLRAGAAPDAARDKLRSLLREARACE